MLDFTNESGCNSCFYSSFVFISNVLVALYYGYYLYAALFFALIISSAFHHLYYTKLTNAIDKVIIYCIVFYGGYLFYNKLKEYSGDSKNSITIKEYILSFFIIFTFLFTIFLYYYGYLYSCLCFSDDKTHSNLFHSFMHCVSSFGHCCIAIL